MKFTTIQIETLRGTGGAISFSFIPEDGSIHIHAFDPEDKRKSGISIHLPETDGATLKLILQKIDAAKEEEIQRRLRLSSSTPDKDGQIIVTLSSGASVCLPDDIYKQAAQLISDGKTMLAASLIGKRLTWLSSSGALEVAQLICEQQQAIGIRK